MTGVAALASVLDRHVTDAAFESGCRLSCGYSGDDLTEHMAESIIASVWLAEHDAAVRAAERERVAVGLAALRIRNPMNGDGSNYMLDKVIVKIDKLAGDDGAGRAFEMEEARLGDIDDADYCERYGMALPSKTRVERLNIARSAGDVTS